MSFVKGMENGNNKKYCSLFDLFSADVKDLKDVSEKYGQFIIYCNIL